jgi:serine protease Do
VKVGEQKYQADIVATAPESDLALLKLKEGVPYLQHTKIATEAPQRGSKAYLLGFPLGVDGSIVPGYISAKEWIKFPWWDYLFPVYTFHGGTLPGNSGGGVFNEKKELVGVMFALNRGINHGYAIPLELIKEFLEKNGYKDLYEASTER